MPSKLPAPYLNTGQSRTTPYILGPTSTHFMAPCSYTWTILKTLSELKSWVSSVRSRTIRHAYCSHRRLCLQFCCLILTTLAPPTYRFEHLLIVRHRLARILVKVVKILIQFSKEFFYILNDLYSCMLTYLTNILQRLLQFSPLCKTKRNKNYMKVASISDALIQLGDIDPNVLMKKVKENIHLYRNKTAYEKLSHHLENMLLANK